MSFTAVLMSLARVLVRPCGAVVCVGGGFLQALEIGHEIDQLGNSQTRVVLGHPRQTVWPGVALLSDDHRIRVENRLGEIRCRVMRSHTRKIWANIPGWVLWEMLSCDVMARVALQGNKDLTAHS